MKKIFTTSSGSFIVISLLFIFCILSDSCKKKSDPVPGTNEVWMQNTAFNPSSISVALNTTITWTNKDGTNHTVTSDSSSFNSSTISNGGTYSHQFTVAGTYSYHCSIHSHMTGSVIVH